MKVIHIYEKGIKIPIDEKTPIALNYSLSDFRAFTKSQQKSYSKTLKVIGTPEINKKLGNIFDFKVSFGNDFGLLPPLDYNKKVKAKLLVDDIPVFTGNIRLLKVTVQNGVPVYDIKFVTEIVDRLSDLKKYKLADLGLPDYSHQLTHANVRNSQLGQCYVNGTLTNVSGQGVGYVYAPFFYGLLHQNHNTTSYYTQPTSTLNTDKLPLFFFVYELFTKAFEKIGLTINSSFISTNLFKKLVLSGDINMFGTSAAGITGSHAEATLTSKSYTTPVLTFDTGGWIGGKEIRVLRDCTIVTNPNNQIDFSNSLYDFYNRYNADTTFKWQVTFDIKVTANQPITSNLLRVLIDVESGYSNNIITQESVHLQIGVLKTVTIELPIGVNWTNAYRLELFVGGYGAGASNGLELTIDISNFTFKSDRNDVISTYNATINPKDFLPKLNAYDLVRAISHIFNLQFSEIENETITIEPGGDFYNAYTDDDWTKKIDRKTYELRLLTTEFKHNRIDYKYKDPNDVLSTAYKLNAGKEYSEGLYDVDNDWAKGTLKQDVPLVIARPVAIDNTPLIYNCFYGYKNGNYERVNLPPVLGFWAGNKTGNITYLDKDVGTGVVTQTAYTDYPLISHFDDEAAPTLDLSFGLNTYLFYTAPAVTNNNVFTKYHYPLLRELYDENARMLIVSVKLTAQDIATLDLRNIVMIDGVLWRVNRIIDWTPDKPLTRVELIRIIDDIAVDLGNSYGTGTALPNDTGATARLTTLLPKAYDGAVATAPNGVITYDRNNNTIGVGGQRSGKLPKLEYHATITQVGTGDPTVSNVWNGAETSPIFKRISAGVYEVQWTNAFNGNVQLTLSNQLDGNMVWYVKDVNTIVIKVSKDDILNNDHLVIKVY